MVDALTYALASLDVQALTSLSRLVDVYTPIVFPVIALALYLGYPKVRRNRLRVCAFFLGLALVAALVFFVKYSNEVPRPCAEFPSLSKLGYCPPDYSFPSLHAAFAFVFAGASLGTTFFPLFLLLSLMVAFTRVYAGAHMIGDVVGGAAIALAAYFAVETLLREHFPAIVPPNERRKVERRKDGGLALEVMRNAVHAGFGSAVVLAALSFGVAWTETLLFSALVLGMVSMHYRMRGIPQPALDWLFDLLERPRVIPAKGAFMYAFGVLLALSFLPAPEALAVIAVLAWGDSAATVAGKALGGPEWPHNRGKSVAGSAAFAVFGALAAYPLAGPVAVPLALACALVETIGLGIDDNLLIPVAGIMFFALA
ncbi:MAG: phosphatase PAP2 family protein [Candidatus ainarchaeum sp.]|nr:phosphatase PAP2 family protein [Candidatus ainarchaeum sp.]